VLATLAAAFGVGLDNFGVSIGLGSSPHGRRVRWRVAIVFGVFEAVMPLVGILVGRSVAGTLSGTVPAVGGAVVGLLGAYTVLSATVLKRPEASVPQEVGLVRLVALGAIISIDNLVIGFALGAYGVNLLTAVLLIGVVSVGLSLLGIEFGARLGAAMGERAEIVGGVALIAVGFAIGLGLH
jgi:putative Mn2+ efflux pump MntP